MKRPPPPSSDKIVMNVLETAKAEERSAAIVLVMEDLDALKVIEAWRTIAHKPVADRPFAPNETMAEALADLWDKIDPNFAEIADLARIPMMVAVSQFIRLKHARLIYPDGSIHRTARAVLDSRAAAYLKSIQPH